MNHTNPPLVVGLGESLFDCFPDRMLLGGAPVNVAVHAQRMLAEVGGEAIAATRVGDDDLGAKYLDEVRRRGLDVSAVQLDAIHPTGTVTVQIDEAGHASYVFASDVAWDHLQFTDGWRALAESCGGVAFGTLAQRETQSRETIHQFLTAASGAFRLFDVNLRGDFYTAEVIEQSLRHASAVKLNEDELPLVCQLLEFDNPATSTTDDQAEAVRTKFGLMWVALTQGARGTALYTAGGRVEGAPVKLPPHPHADTVGAGDAASASLLIGQLLGWPPERMLRLANHAGAFVATQPGATPQLPAAVLELVSGREQY